MNLLGTVKNGSGGQELSRMRRHIFDQDQRHVTNITFLSANNAFPNTLHRVASACRLCYFQGYLFCWFPEARFDLFGRSLDPILGVCTGIFAFYLNQTNPRTAPPPGDTLPELFSWKRAKSRSFKLEKMELEKDTELEATLVSLLAEENKSR